MERLGNDLQRQNVTHPPSEIILVAGARPNFVKLAPLYHELCHRLERFRPIILHTGQHYDAQMSDVFFRELDLPEPHIFLGVGSGSHAEQTARIMLGVEETLTNRKPALVVVFGDVNSTLAATITAAKLNVPVAHVEAGLRSFDRSMPEEINRLVADALGDLLLTPSRDADRNLLSEGVAPEKIVMVGNIMIDTLVRFMPRAEESTVIRDLGLTSGRYALMTMHRPGNVDHAHTIETLVRIIDELTATHPVVFPAHPRTRKNLLAMGGRAAELMNGARANLIVTEPLGYFDFLKLQKESGVTLTDSGGVQEETTFLGVPCLTLRPNTERPVTITHGSNHLIGLDSVAAIEHARRFLDAPRRSYATPPLWDGRAASRIVDAFERFLFVTPHATFVDTQSDRRRVDAMSALMDTPNELSHTR